MLSKAVDDGSIVAPAFFALLFAGQTLLKLAAKDGCMVGSTSCVALKLRILFWKEEQWENPRVWPPAKRHIQNNILIMDRGKRIQRS